MNIVTPWLVSSPTLENLNPFPLLFICVSCFANVKSLILVYTLHLILSWSWSFFLFPLVPFKAYPGYLAWLSTLDLGVNSCPHIYLIELLLVSMSFHSKVSFYFLDDPCHVPWSKPTQVTWTNKLSTRRLKSICNTHNNIWTRKNWHHDSTPTHNFILPRSTVKPKC
jgi:hypothetical protein